MALSLSAEQNNLRSLFINDDRYIVPSFQRPYRWTKKETKQLFDDITQAFTSNEDYFVGNIVIARGNDDKSRPQIIDGQQRILTLWMYLKVLAILTNVSRLEEMLSIRDWEDDKVLSKIDSLVFEEEDQSGIEDLLTWKQDDFKSKTKEISKLGLIQSNAVYIYKWLQEYFNRIDNTSQTAFWKYFIDRVYLLPIVLDGQDMAEATTRALTIFETINNRGLDLADADILKAKLYEMAMSIKEGVDFISQWKDLGQKCVELNVSVNDVFRYYLRILRAKNDQTTSEPNLRNFFLNNDFSPFKTKKWKTIMAELNLIESVLENIDALKRSSAKTALLYQVLQEHSSAIPLSAMVIFVYTILESGNKLEEQEVIDFLENLIRICYTYDLSQDIKYKVFDINARVMNKRPLPLSTTNFSDDFFEERRRYRNGFVMLYHYLVEDNLNTTEIDSFLKVERIVRQNDLSAHSDWPADTIGQDIENMANFSIIDFPKSYKSLSERSFSYNSSTLASVSSILKNKRYYSYTDFNERKNNMQKTLSKFLIQSEGEKDNNN
jgi:uncharacterized protein with ParB-like and HNH nuclease domain